MLEMADALEKNRRIQEADRMSQLQTLIAVEGPKAGQGMWPLWIEQEYRAMRSEQLKSETASDRAFRRARSMLWKPTELSEERLEELIASHGETLSELMADIWRQTDREEQLDVVLKSHWDAMSPQEHKAALVHARYTCIRKLGWRRGYSSGYPSPDGSVSEEREELLKKLRKGGESATGQAITELAEEEEESAWHAFQSMSEPERRQEERMAWQLRDRSLLFIDDASSSLVAGAHTPRWYPAPQREGALTFLPNDIVRLVRNTTRRTGQYDPFKATFRVPLHMHKHSVRSYLLAIYGLRTTWCRSMIYRAPIVRTRLGQKRVGSSRRTFKKVEVGLLEPFVYPEITENFKREHLLSEEMRAATTAIRYRMSRQQRWRTVRLPDAPEYDPNSAAIEETSLTTRIEANKETKHTAVQPGNRAAQDKLRLSTFSGGVPTKRHSRILQMLTNQRKVREAELASRVKTLREEHSGTERQ